MIHPGTDLEIESGRQYAVIWDADDERGEVFYMDSEPDRAEYAAQCMAQGITYRPVYTNGKRA